MFTASYPATFLRERNPPGFHVRFPDLPEALTSGEDLADTQLQAADCLAEAIAGRIARNDPISPLPEPNAASTSSAFRSTSRRSLPYTSPCVHRSFQAPGSQRNRDPPHAES
jgi:predicted RNase H-like HicB family nuclease